MPSYHHHHDRSRRSTHTHNKMHHPHQHPWEHITSEWFYSAVVFEAIAVQFSSPPYLFACDSGHGCPEASHSVRGTHVGSAVVFFRSAFFDPSVRASVVQGKTSAHEGFAQ